MKKKNLLQQLRVDSASEIFETLHQTAGITIERIVSCGQATPTGEWLSEERAEWVMVLQGEGKLLFEGRPDEIVMVPGDSIYIPPSTRHRVTMTSKSPPTIWLAVHFKDSDAGLTT